MFSPIPSARPKTLLLASFLVALALTAAIAKMEDYRWLGWWPATVRTICSSQLFSASVVGVTAALMASTTLSFGMGQWGASAVKRRSSQLRVVLFVAVLPTLLAVAVVAAVMIVLTARAGGLEGGIAWAVAQLVVGPLQLVWWACIGIWLGLRLPLVIAAGLSGLAPYIYSFVMEWYFYDSPLAILLYVDSGSNYLEVRPAMSTLLIQGVLFLSVAVFLYAVVVGGGDRLRLVAGIATSVALSVGLLAGFTYTPINGAGSESCLGTDPRLCVRRPFAASLPAYRQIVNEVWLLIPPSRRPDEIKEEGLATPHSRRVLTAAPASGVTSPTLLPARIPTLLVLGEALWLDEQTCEANATDQGAFRLWWGRTVGIPTDGSAGPGQGDYRLRYDSGAVEAGARRLAAMSTQERDQWLVHLLAPERCRK